MRSIFSGRSRSAALFCRHFARGLIRRSQVWLDGSWGSIALFRVVERLGYYMQWFDRKVFGGLGRRIGFEGAALGGLFLAVGTLVGFVTFGQGSLPAGVFLDRVPLVRPVASLYLPDARAVAATFDRHGYRLDRVRRDGIVPRVFLATLPSDLDAVAVVGERKQLFLQTVLPLVLHVNETILGQRQRALALYEAKQAGVRLSKPEHDWLAALHDYYRVAEGDSAELFRRLDVVPPSLALAQAVEESGWGTSRFAQEGNAIFGQWALTSRHGLVPAQRDAGARHSVRRFGELAGSVRAYIRNLNTHRAYREFRAKRAVLRRLPMPLNGYVLADTLQRYSERGDAYVATLRVLIRSNKLRNFDRAKLAGDVYASLSEPDA